MGRPSFLKPVNDKIPIKHYRSVLREKIADLDIDKVFKKIGLTVQEFFRTIPEYSKNPVVLELLSWWKKQSNETRRHMTFARMCHLRDISHRDMYVILSGFCYDSGMERAKRLIGINLPALAEASILNSLNQGELPQKERQKWLESVGFFVVPKGAQTTVDVHVTAARSAEATGLPSFESTINLDAEDIRAVRLLPSTVETIDLPSFLSDTPVDVPSADNSTADHEGQ